VVGPKKPPSGTVLSAEPFQLAVFVYTVLPHHFCQWAEFAPILPLLGYCQKKTKIAPIATPESRAPDWILLYFDHQEK